MVLPTYESFLASLKVIDLSNNDSMSPNIPATMTETQDSNECPICSEPFTDPVRTPCNHVFCKSDLLQWLEDDNTCPCCRTELYEFDDEVRTPDMLEHRFTVSQYERLEYLAELIANGETPAYDVEEEMHARVDCAGLMPKLVALIDFLKPEASGSLQQGQMEDICRPEWKVIAGILFMVLQKINGRMIKGSELLELLTRWVRQGLTHVNRPSPVYAVASVEARGTFQQDLEVVLRATVSISQDIHKESHRRQCRAAIAKQYGLSQYEVEFERNEQVKNVAAESLKAVPDYPNGAYIDAKCSFLAAVVATMRTKPRVELHPPHSLAYAVKVHRDLRSVQWQHVIRILRTSFNLLHDQVLEASELYRRLSDALLHGLYPVTRGHKVVRVAYDYGETYKGPSTFWNDVDNVVRMVVVQAMAIQEEYEADSESEEEMQWEEESEDESVEDAESEEREMDSEDVDMEAA